MLGVVAAALAFSIALPWCLSQMWLAMRARGYRSKKALAAPPRQFDERVLSLTLEWQHEARRKKGSLLREILQLSATDAQNRYQTALAYGVSALAVAFLTLSIAVALGQYHEDIVVFSSLVDVICFLLSFFAFLRASYWNRKWMLRRSKNEMLRQWCVLDNIFLRDGTEADVIREYAEMEQKIDSEIGYEPQSGWDTLRRVIGAGSHERDNSLSSSVLAAWKHRRSEFIDNFTRSSITFAQYAVYFRKRPMSQADWFRRSYSRISRYGHWRETTLQRIFFVTLVVALIKSWLLLAGPKELAWLKPWTTLGILVLIGLSVAISALYFNQNNRSLAHRYSTQVRLIDGWLDNHLSFIKNVAASFDLAVISPAAMGEDLKVSASPSESELAIGRSLEIDAQAKRDLLEQILRFEDLMIEELLDFLSISEQDSLEISAA